MLSKEEFSMLNFGDQLVIKGPWTPPLDGSLATFIKHINHEICYVRLENNEAEKWARERWSTIFSAGGYMQIHRNYLQARPVDIGTVIAPEAFESMF